MTTRVWRRSAQLTTALLDANADGTHCNDCVRTRSTTGTDSKHVWCVSTNPSKQVAANWSSRSQLLLSPHIWQSIRPVSCSGWRTVLRISFSMQRRKHSTGSDEAIRGHSNFGTSCQMPGHAVMSWHVILRQSGLSPSRQMLDYENALISNVEVGWSIAFRSNVLTVRAFAAPDDGPTGCFRPLS